MIVTNDDRGAVFTRSSGKENGRVLLIRRETAEVFLLRPRQEGWGAGEDPANCHIPWSAIGSEAYLCREAPCFAVFLSSKKQKGEPK
jgi:hypothetical protein